MKSVTEKTKSLAEVMKLMFTKLTLSQSRKGELYRIKGFNVAVIAVDGVNIALGMKGKNYGVFEYDSENEAIGLLIWKLVPELSEIFVHQSKTIVLAGDPHDVSDQYLVLCTLLNMIKAACVEQKVDC